MKSEIEIRSVPQLLDTLRVAPVIVPLRISAADQSQLVTCTADLGVSPVAIDVSDIDSDNDFLIAINSSLRELRLSDLLGNIVNRRITHVFLMSSLHQADDTLGAQIISVAQAFSSTSIRFCVLLPENWMGSELGVVRQLLDKAASILCCRLRGESIPVQPSREALLLSRIAELERSLQRLDERSRVLESRGKKLRESLDSVDVSGFIESIRPADGLHEAVKSRIDRVAQDSTAISGRLADYE